MSNPLFVGLDVHRDEIVATALEGDGYRADQTRLPSRSEVLVRYLKGLPGSTHVVLEACTLWEYIYDAASSVAESVVLANPYKTRLIAEASLKSDKVDSHTLAELLRLNAVPTAYAPEPEIRKLRHLVRERQHIKRLETRVKNHIYSLLLRRGIPYEERILGFKRKRETLRELGNPDINRGLDILCSLESFCAGLDQEIEDAYNNSYEGQLLTTIPGIGKLTAMTLVAEICPIERFPNAEKLCSYAGLVPTVHQSGDRCYHGRLKKDSNTLLKTIMIEAAWAHRRLAKQSDVSKLGRRVARRRGKCKGNVAAARKLLKIVYAILKRGTPYSPERLDRGDTSATS